MELNMKKSMNKLFKIIYFFLVSVILISCTEDNNTSIKKSIQSVIEKFPQLKTNKESSSNDYKLIRSIKNGEFNFEIQLFSEPDSIREKQQIIVFINSKKECYSIPFFSNKYKDYWQFPFEKVNRNIEKVNSTFSDQLNSVLYKLTKLDHGNKKNIDYEVINDLVYSVLKCEKIEEKDSLLVYKTIYPNLDMPNENQEESLNRLKKNYLLMKKNWGPKKNKTNYICYLDKKNGRIYQFNFNNQKNLEIKAYRQDWGTSYMQL